MDDDRIRFGTALDTACPSAATDIQSVEYKHHTANKRNPCLTQCARCPPEVRSATWFLVLRRFHRGPCFPEYLPPIGQDLRLTIVSTDENDPASKSDGDAINDVRGDKADDEKKLDSIREMYAALRACWLPPPRDPARHGMEYTIRFAFKRDGGIMAQPRVTYSSHEAPAKVRDVYRDAVNAALTRCTPLHFSKGMGGAVAGRQIAIRFVDDRTINNGKTLQ